MKSTLPLSLALLAAAAPHAHAWSYSDGDALLIFRATGFNDVEFDLGPVSQFLNHPAGYTAAVTNWDLSLVTGVFGSDLTGVSVILAATTSRSSASPAAWLSNSSDGTTPADVTPSAWQGNLWSTINSLGTRPTLYLVPTAGTAAYSIAPSGSYALASYDQIVSGNGVNLGSLTEFGGHAAFPVELVVPGVAGFWQIAPSTALPKPAAGLVGSFTITAAGALTFSSGAAVPPTTISAVQRTGTATTVTFNTSAGGTYYLASTNQLGGASSTWPVVAGPLAGDGTSHSLSYTNSATAAYFRVLRTQ